MSFLKNFFYTKKQTKSVVLIDIGNDSVAGAYAHYQEDCAPNLLYTQHFSIEVRGDETHENALLRTIQTLGNDLIREGAPTLARITGSGSADSILVSIDTPGQETAVHTEHFEAKDPFTFTKNMVEERLKKSAVTISDKQIIDESVIETTLNGYTTNSPYGKKVHRSSATIFTSLAPAETALNIRSTIERLFHTRNVHLISGVSLRYQALRDVFPHEHNAIILDTTSVLSTSIALIRKNMFVTMTSLTVPLSDEAWMSSIMSELESIAEQHPLPQTIFLLSRDSDIFPLRQKMAVTPFARCGYLKTPPKIVPMIKGMIRVSTSHANTDLSNTTLLLMALTDNKKWMDSYRSSV
ncbi:MAG: hypothetical protein WAW90_01435 [Minisyncoccia bacterium]